MVYTRYHREEGRLLLVVADAGVVVVRLGVSEADVGAETCLAFA